MSRNFIMINIFQENFKKTVKHFKISDLFKLIVKKTITTFTKIINILQIF